MVGAVLFVTASLAVIALLVFAVSVIAFLIQTSRHRPSRRWAAAAGASLVLVLVFGGIANALQGGGGPILSEEQASAPDAVGQADYDATATVTRVVDGDTIEISPSVVGLSTVRLSGWTPPKPTAVRSPTERRPATSPTKTSKEK